MIIDFAKKSCVLCLTYVLYLSMDEFRGKTARFEYSGESLTALSVVTMETVVMQIAENLTVSTDH